MRKCVYSDQYALSAPVSGLWLKSLRAQRVLTKTQTQKIVFTFLCRYK